MSSYGDTDTEQGDTKSNPPVPADPQKARAAEPESISGARTWHELGSDDRELESGSRNLGEFAPLIEARDNLEPRGGAVLKCDRERPRVQGWL
jgi:hypothetical protein